MKTVTVAALLLTLSTVAFADGPSFNCAKASTYVEKTICGSQLLSKLDVALAKNYKDMLFAANVDGAGDDFKSEQKAWVAKRNKCTTEKCLVDLYRERVDGVCDQATMHVAHPICIEADDIK